MVAEVMATDLQAARIFEDRIPQVQQAFNELGREMDRWPTVSNVIAKLKNSKPKAHQLFPITKEGRACIETAEKHIQAMRDKGFCGVTENTEIKNEGELLSEAGEAFKGINNGGENEIV